jgi:hypothetical protein
MLTFLSIWLIKLCDVWIWPNLECMTIIHGGSKKGLMLFFFSKKWERRGCTEAKPVWPEATELCEESSRSELSTVAPQSNTKHKTTVLENAFAHAISAKHQLCFVPAASPHLTSPSPAPPPFFGQIQRNAVRFGASGERERNQTKFKTRARGIQP